MRAFLLAGGFGTRLRPLTNSLPKCLVPVAGKPLLDYWLEQLVEQAGCEKILINTHYLHQHVEQHIEQSQYYPYVELVHEKELLGTLGSVRANKGFLQADDFILAHADNLCVTDWQAFLGAFSQRATNSLMTMMLFHTDNPASCGMVDMDEAGMLSGYTEKPQGYWQGTLANAAVFVISKSTIDTIMALPEEANDFCRDFLPEQVGKANVFVNDQILIDIGTPQTLQKANRLLNA